MYHALLVSSVVVWLHINTPCWAQKGDIGITRPDDAGTSAILSESDASGGDGPDVVAGNCLFTCNPFSGDCCGGFCFCHPNCATTFCNPSCNPLNALCDPACGGNICHPGCPQQCDRFVCYQNYCSTLCDPIPQCNVLCGGNPCNPGCPNTQCNLSCGGDPCNSGCRDECTTNCPGNLMCKPACGGSLCNAACPLGCSVLCRLGTCIPSCPPSWVSGIGTPGMGNEVEALTVFDDDANGPHPPALYAGGLFYTAGGVSVNYIAKWNGSVWSALGSGIGSDVRALTVFDDDANGLHPPALYAGGQFIMAGGVPANRIAKWNPGPPGTWSALGIGMNAPVEALTVFDDGTGTGPALYAGGTFSTAGGIPSSSIAKWNGSGWSALGSGFSGNVYALTVFDDDANGPHPPALYAGGVFQLTGPGTFRSYNIAKWNPGAPGTWSALGNGMNYPTYGAGGTVWALTGFNDGSGPALYAGGAFTTAGGVAANNIAKWKGATWSALGSGMNNPPGFPVFVNALTVFNDRTGPALYAGGDFTTAGGVSANRIAKWKGSVWSPLGSGMNNVPVLALTVFDDGIVPALYAGGNFSTAGGIPSRNIAKWAPCPLPVSRKWFVNGYIIAHVSGLNDGTSWGNAFTSLQDALVAAEPGDEIWVAKGTYKPDGRDGSRTATFQLKSGVEIYGGFAGDESSRDLRNPIHNETILSGDLYGNDRKVPCTAHSPDCDSFGRLCDDGFCIISYRNFENSHHVVTGSGTDATAILAGFTIRDGNAIELETAGISYGGGMLVQNGSPTVFDCTFSGNLGAGMYNESGNPTVSNCTFRGNSATSGGGIGGGGNPTVTNCAFIRNSANEGGGMAGFSGSATVNNCTFSGNNAANRGGGMYNSAGSPTVINCVLWGDSPNEIVNDSSSPTIRFSDVQGGLPVGAVDGGGNIDVNPMFVHAPDLGTDGNKAGVGYDYVDLRLQPGSPCINASDSKLAAHSGETDLDGHSRVLCGVVDMGAYEFGIGDYNCDRSVNLADFAGWATCETGPQSGPYDVGCEAFDFDGDRDVDLFDFGGFQKIIGP